MSAAIAPAVSPEAEVVQASEGSNQSETVTVTVPAAAADPASGSEKENDVTSLPPPEAYQPKAKEEFRNYTNSKRQEGVAAFYREQHERMTYSFVESMEVKYLGLNHFKMGIWEALEFLDTLVDSSDPDTEHSQIQHALQTAEAIRADYPGEEWEWFVLTGLIHDLGKILCLACKEPQWCTVGDTFPVGCAFESSNVFPEFFANNPDTHDERYNTKYGIYQPNCGIENVKMSWGHDEFLFQVCVRNGCTLPKAGLAAIRFHSFYSWHTHGGYRHLMADGDEEIRQHVLRFNKYDLYSKDRPLQDVEKLKPYYQKLIRKFFPETINW